MKNDSLNKLGFVTVILAISGMAFGIILPAGSVRRVAASENVATAQPQQEPAAEQVNQQLGNIPVYFEENRGQQNQRVKYLSRGGGTELFLTATEAVYVVRSPKSQVQSPKPEIDDLKNPQFAISNQQSEKAVAVYMRLAGANEHANFAPSQELAHRTNYFKGNESDWRTEIPNYQRITAENIYEGIDMIWHGKPQGGIQYDFVVAPNANPNLIEWEIEGADNVSLDAEGGLVIETEAGVLKQSKPFTFQETEGVKSEVASGFILSEPPASAGGQSSRIYKVKFALGEYDRTKPLTIDPLAYSTFLGGESDDRGSGIAVDGAGNVYVTGFAFSTVFPTTAGAFDTTQNGLQDAFITKLNAGGSALVYSTFIGGGGRDEGNSIAVDSSGSAFVTGYTWGSFPTTAGAFDTTFNGNLTDGFLTKLDAAGSSIVYSTYLGGVSSNSACYGIAVDSSGNVFVTGETGSGAYPTTPGAFDTTHNGDLDVFVTKLNADGSALIYSTFIGGNSTDTARDIAVDSSGNAFVTGYTQGGTTAYPTTAGAFDTTHNGNLDVFVTKLNAAGSALVNSTFLGGNLDDYGSGIAVDSSGNAFVTGYTQGGAPAYPTTAGAFDTTHNGGNFDVFVTKLDAAGSSLVYSTFIGGISWDSGSNIAVDSSGSAFVAGATDSAAYPTTAGAFDTTHNGILDGFVTKLNAAGSGLMYSTFLGGNADDYCSSIALDSSGNAFVTGATNDGGTDYPTTVGAFDTTHNGVFDVFVTKLSPAPTAAMVAVSGRITTANGYGIRNVIVTLTDTNGARRNAISSPFGYFRFDNVEAGQTYILSVSSKRYVFSNPIQVISVSDEITDLVFTADPL